MANPTRFMCSIQASLSKISRCEALRWVLWFMAWRVLILRKPGKSYPCRMITRCVRCLRWVVPAIPINCRRKCAPSRSPRRANQCERSSARGNLLFRHDRYFTATATAGAGKTTPMSASAGAFARARVSSAKIKNVWSSPSPV